VSRAPLSLRAACRLIQAAGRAVEIWCPGIPGCPRFRLHSELTAVALKEKVAAAATGSGDERGLYFGGSRRIGTRTREHHGKWTAERRGFPASARRGAKRALELAEAGEAGGRKRRRAAAGAAAPAAEAGAHAGIVVGVYYASLNRRPNDRHSVSARVTSLPGRALSRACAVQIEDMETEVAGMGEQGRAKAARTEKEAAEWKQLVAQFLRSAGSAKQEVVPHFLFQNTHTVSGLGGGGRTAGYLHVCAEQDLDAAMSYCARPAMQCAQMRELRLVLRVQASQRLTGPCPSRGGGSRRRWARMPSRRT